MNLRRRIYIGCAILLVAAVFLVIRVIRIDSGGDDRTGNPQSTAQHSTRNAGGTVDRHVNLLSKDPFRVHGLSESDLLSRIDLAGGILDQESLRIVCSWTAINGRIPLRVLEMLRDKSQKYEILEVCISEAFDGFDVDPFVEALELVKHKQTKVDLHRQLVAKCVKSGNLDWPIQKAESLPPGSLSATILRSIFENADPVDVDQLAGLLRSLDDPREIREARLAFTAWFLPKLDKQQLQRLKLEHPGAEFEKYVDTALAKLMTTDELTLLISEKRNGLDESSGRQAIYELARREPEKLIELTKNSENLLDDDELAATARYMARSDFAKAAELLESVGQSNEKARTASFSIFRSAAEYNSLDLSKWIGANPDSPLADVARIELVRFLVGSGATRDALPYVGTIDDPKLRKIADELTKNQ